MALIGSAIKFTKGKIGNISIYQDSRGRTHGRSLPSRKPRKVEKSWDTVFKNNMDFREAATVAKTIRRGLIVRLDDMKDAEHYNRLTGLLKHVSDTDFNSRQGSRDCFKGNLNLLLGFEFNENCRLKDAFRGKYTSTIDPERGKMTVEFDSFYPAFDIDGPREARFCQLVVQGTTFSRNDQLAANRSSRLIDMSSTDSTAPLSIELDLQPGPGEIMVLAVGLLFYEECYGVPLALRGGAQWIVDITITDEPDIQVDRTSKKLSLAEYHARLDAVLSKRYRCRTPLYEAKEMPGYWDELQEQLRQMRRKLHEQELYCLRNGLHSEEGSAFRAKKRRFG